MTGTEALDTSSWMTWMSSFFHSGSPSSDVKSSSYLPTNTVRRKPSLGENLPSGAVIPNTTLEELFPFLENGYP